MSKKNVKQGEQTVDSPHDPVVTTPSGLIIPQEPPLVGDTNVVTEDLSGFSPELLAALGLEAATSVPESPEPSHMFEAPLVDHTILLESGVRVPHTKGAYPEFKVTAADGHHYEHVAEAPDGEWVYRRA